MNYPWKRFWCPRNGTINLSDGGFLYDPESEYSKWIESDVVPYEQIESKSCIALLGVPGIGKSTTIEELREAAIQSLDSKDDKILYINLNEYGDESRLIRDTFECKTFSAWKNGSFNLHIFLNSLDECRIQIPQVATILIKRFNQVRSQLKRIRLRIACRTFDWPINLDQSLPELWGEDNVEVVELCPLRRKDVVAAAETNGIDVDKFIAELVRTESIPLAIKPITLNFLLSTFKSKYRLPNTRKELFDKGCNILCEESNLTRILSGSDQAN